MVLRPHARARYRFMSPETYDWEDAEWNGYVEEQSDEAILKELIARRGQCQIELLEVRWKMM